MIDYQRDQLKFWLRPRDQKWLFHPIEVHHNKVVADNYAKMGVPKEEILHNPYVGDSPNTWDDEDANNDIAVTAAALRQGWIRGGHIVDYQRYLSGQIVHLGGLYVQGLELIQLRRAARLVLDRHADLHYLAVEQSDPQGGQIRLIRLQVDQIDRFVRRGHLPSEAV